MNPTEHCPICESVKHWRDRARFWAENRPERLLGMAHETHWLGCVENDDQIILIAVKCTDVADAFTVLLNSIPSECNVPVMTAFGAWVTARVAVELKDLPEGEKNRLILGGKQAAIDAIDKLTSPDKFEA